MNREDVQSYLMKIIKQFFNQYSKNYIIEKPILGWKALSKFARKQYEENNLSIAQVLNLAKTTKADKNFTIYEKIAQYFGFPITEAEQNRDVFILFNMLEWYYENFI